MNTNLFRLSGIILLLLAMAASVGCGQAAGLSEGGPSEKSSDTASPAPAVPENMSEMFKGEVVDIINAGRYAYLQIDTGEKKVWVAVPSFDGKIGDMVLVPPGVPVADFQSKKLDRRFDMIYFVGGVRRVGEDAPEPAENQTK